MSAINSADRAGETQLLPRERALKHVRMIALLCFAGGWGLFWACSLNLIPLPLWPALILLGIGLLAIPLMCAGDASVRASVSRWGSGE